MLIGPETVRNLLNERRDDVSARIRRIRKDITGFDFPLYTKEEEKYIQQEGGKELQILERYKQFLSRELDGRVSVWTGLFLLGVPADYIRENIRPWDWGPGEKDIGERALQLIGQNSIETIVSMLEQGVQLISR